MCFEKRKKVALEELKKSGIWRSNYMPPALKLMWKIGLKVRPPHYNYFLHNALSLGLWFAIAWGILMWFFQWRSMEISILVAIGFAAATGIFFGVFMASYYKWSAKKHHLSSWSELTLEKKNVKKDTISPRSLDSQ